MNLLKDMALYYSKGMGPFMDQFLRLYDKDDHPSYGMYKIWLEEVADTLGYVKGLDSNMRPYYRILPELTNEYLVKTETSLQSEWPMPQSPIQQGSIAVHLVWLVSGSGMAPSLQQEPGNYAVGQ